MAEIPLGKLASTIGVRLDRLVMAVKIAIFSAIVRDTRVDTGRLRGNWIVSNHEPMFHTSLENDKTGARVISEIIKTVKPETVDYFVNNLPYAEVWEKKDAMVAKNVVRVEGILRKMAKGMS